MYKRQAIHGLSLNVSTASTEVFRQRLFVPCGVSGARVTSLVEEGAPLTLTPLEVMSLFAAALTSANGQPSPSIEEVSVWSLLDVVPTALAG